MLDIANDIRSLSNFKRNTSELLERLKKTGNPLVLTINGKAQVVVQHAKAYQELLERVETIEGIQRGLADVKARFRSSELRLSIGVTALLRMSRPEIGRQVFYVPRLADAL
jgi:prevent-host-death family protein